MKDDQYGVLRASAPMPCQVASVVRGSVLRRPIVRIRRHGAAGDRDPFPAELSTDLPDAIDSEVLVLHPADLDLHSGIAMGPCRQLARIGAPGGVGMTSTGRSARRGGSARPRGWRGAR
jgi:hypothetical protein